MSAEIDGDSSESKLGTKEYWEDHYEREIANFEANGDDGEVWFGGRSEQRILKFVLDYLPERRTTTIAELGCGNASLLRKLRSKGYSQLSGLDYSPKALELGRRVCEDVDADSQLIVPEFHLVDLTAADSVGASSTLAGRFDCIIDKGTFDAISLAPGSADKKAERVRNYRRAILGLARRGANTATNSPYFIIVSCNFTRMDLVETFEGAELKFHAELPNTGTFTFGGQSGATFTGVVFWLTTSSN